MDEKSEVIEMTADIVSAYVGNNSVTASDLPSLIQSVHRALAGISSGAEAAEAAPRNPPFRYVARSRPITSCARKMGASSSR
jgi:predicted transcriptional regulator